MKFPWSKVVDRFEWDMVGRLLSVVKYHPWKNEGPFVKRGQPNENETLYSCGEMSWSYRSLDSLLVGWITFKHLGINQMSLVSGICRAIGIEE